MTPKKGEKTRMLIHLTLKVDLTAGTVTIQGIDSDGAPIPPQEHKADNLDQLCTGAIGIVGDIIRLVVKP
jgi:hypothetical protein